LAPPSQPSPKGEGVGINHFPLGGNRKGGYMKDIENTFNFYNILQTHFFLIMNKNKIVNRAFTKIFIKPKSKWKDLIKKPLRIQVKNAAETQATGTHFSLNLIFENSPVRYKPKIGP
jgi:hypothetical protein